MNELEARLVRCFATVFPETSPDTLKNATMDTLEAWDSLKAVILINVVEEEFGIQIDPAEFTELTSFSSFADYLRSSIVS